MIGRLLERAQRPLRAPLDAALSREIAELDLTVARMSRFLYAGGGVVSLALAFTIAPALGIFCAGVCAIYVGWYSFTTWLYESGRMDPTLRVLAAIVDGTVPWVFTLGVALAQGPTYALASWVPPMLFCMLILGAVTRLRPGMSIVFGASAGGLYLALYLGFLRSQLTASEAESVLFAPPMQVTRGLFLLLAGLGGAVLAVRLREVFARAETRVREEELFGKYRLGEPLGSGGMGEVMVATYCPEGGFERRVAMKRIHPHLADQPRFVAAFRQEAELSSRLAHPNLVQVLDFGRIGETYFLAMEYVDGLTLASLVARLPKHERALPPDIVAHIGAELLAGLGHAHAGALGDDGLPLHVVHRDLCPQNVLLSRNGEVKVADFGVARALGDASRAHTKHIAGHLGYLAPEQARGQPIDERSDLFAVGIVLWELLVGRPLFLLDTEAATLMAVIEHQPIPPTAFRPELDPTWDGFFQTALARDPAARFTSAFSMREALSVIPDGQGASVRERLAAFVERASGMVELSLSGENPAATVAHVRPASG